MGSLLGDLFFGGQSRTDRQQITDLYKTLGPLAKSATEAGQAGVGDTMAYYRNLLHGGQQAQQEAIAPEENAAEAQQQARRRALESSGTSRGGGVNAAEQQGADLATQTGVNALTALVPQAARAEGGLGLQETGQGLQAGQQLGTLSEAERRTNLAHQTQEGSDLGKAISLGAAFATGTAPNAPGAATIPSDIAPQAAGGTVGTAPGTEGTDWLAALARQYPELGTQPTVMPQ